MLIGKEDRQFSQYSCEFRIIEKNLAPEGYVMRHTFTNFDRLGFLQDVNGAFPIDRLNELAAEGIMAQLLNINTRLRARQSLITLSQILIK